MADAAREGGARGVDGAAVAMGVAFALIWSSAFSAAKIALADAPPFLMLTARFALAGALAVGVAAALGQRAPRSRAVWIAVVVFGLCQNAVYLGLNFWAMTRVPAGVAAIIASAVPLVVAALSRLWLGERLHWLGGAGLVVGFAGVALIMGGRIVGGADVLGVAACVVALLALAVATLTVRGMAARDGLLMAVGLQMLVGAAALAPVALALESVADVRPTWSLALAFAYSMLVAGLLATALWFVLVERVGPTPASAYHFLNPAFGVAIAAALLGEGFGPWDAVGVALVTAAILAVQRARAIDAAQARG